MRSVLSRILLVGLVGTALWAVLRVGGGSHDEDAVHLAGLRPDGLVHAAFTVGPGGARVAIDAVGSLDVGVGPDGQPTLAAFGWLVHRDSAAVAWTPRVGPRPARGLVVAERDTVTLAPGTYDAYFTSFGDPDRLPPPPGGTLARLRRSLTGGARTWVGEADRWRFVVTGATDADRALLARLPDDESAPDARALATLVPAETEYMVTTWLRVEAPSRVRLAGVTEVRGGVVEDSLSVYRLDTGRYVWAARPAAGAWAGGAVRNRAYDTTLVLAPGLYRVRAYADETHSPGAWAANPPPVPSQWGLRVYAEPGARVAVQGVNSLDGLPEIARLDCIGPGTDRRLYVDVRDSVAVGVEAVGELSDDDDRYDVGSVERVVGGTPTTLWTMDYGATEHAGGADRNRRQVDWLALEPGLYALRFTTDDSHDCSDDFPGGAPTDPFWGIRLVAATGEVDPETFRVNNEALAGHPPVAEGRVIARLTGLGPDADVSAPFRLDERTDVRVVALGELLPSRRLDWGWIETEDGATVWEMTRGNTVAGGGDAQNRRFDGTVSLDAGSYRVRFVTSERHDADGFDGPPPPNAEDWGIRVERR